MSTQSPAVAVAGMLSDRPASPPTRTMAGASRMNVSPARLSIGLSGTWRLRRP